MFLEIVLILFHCLWKLNEICFCDIALFILQLRCFVLIQTNLKDATFYDDDDDDDDDYDGDLTSYILKISTSCSYEITPFCALSRSWISSWWSWSSAMIGICLCFSDSFCQIQPGNALSEAFGRDWILIYVTLSPTMDFDICYQHVCNKWKWINEMPILGWSSGHISL